MTIKEMLKKVDTYNEVAVMIYAPKAELRVSFSLGGSVLVKSVAEFRKYIRETFVDCVANAILDYGDYELGNVVKFEVDDGYGYTMREKVEFFAE